jgi:hypothetical protein
VTALRSYNQIYRYTRMSTGGTTCYNSISLGSSKVLRCIQFDCLRGMQTYAELMIGHRREVFPTECRLYGNISTALVVSECHSLTGIEKFFSAKMSVLWVRAFFPQFTHAT